MKESLLKGLNLDAARAALQASPDGRDTNLVALYMSLDNIQPDPDQPRRGMEAGADEQSLEELAESILQHGVLQPITVEAIGKGKYQIIAGERRWRAARMALESGKPCSRKDYDLSRIPAVITHSENPTDRLEMQLVENLARADMRDEDVAKALQSLLDALQISKSELARRLGRSRTWVSCMLTKADPIAAELADRIGVPLELIGGNEMQRLLSWQGDPEKDHWIDAVADAIRKGAPFSRSLLNQIEQREPDPEPDHATIIGNTAVVVPLPADDRTVPQPGMMDAASESNSALETGGEKLWDSDGDSTKHSATVAASRYASSVAEGYEGDSQVESGTQSAWEDGEDYGNASCVGLAGSRGGTERQVPANRNAVRVTIPMTLVGRLLEKAGMNDMDPSEGDVLAALELLVE